MKPDETQNVDPVQPLRDRLVALTAEQTAIVQAAAATGREYTDDETNKLTEIEKRQAKLESDIARTVAAFAAADRLNAPEPRKVEAAPTLSATAVSQHGPTSASAAGYHTIYGKDLAATSPTQGFASAQEWFRAIRYAAANPSATDRRLTAAQAAATTYANESAGPDGGWIMPTEFSKDIMEAVAGQGTLLGRMKPIQSSSNVFQVPVDETTGWGTTGVQAASTAEAGASSASKLALQARVVTLFKATSFVSVSEELAADNPASVAYINRVMARQLQGLVERWILRGNGVNEPMGILTAPALISVAKDSGQTAATVTKGNLAKCAGRLIPGSDADAFFVVSPSAKIQIIETLLGAGGNTGGDIQRGFAAIGLGYPVVTSMEAQAAGTAGDCTLVAPSGFITCTKGGINALSSPFFYFDQGLQTLRAYIRLGQVPVLSTAVVPKLDTATTLSHCVTIEART